MEIFANSTVPREFHVVN